MPEESLKQKAKKGIYWTFFNQFAVNGLQFVAGIIMARLLTPSDYGITLLPAVFISIAQVFIEGGFNSAMVRKPELSQRDLSTAFIYSVTIGCLCYALMYFVAPYIAAFYDENVLISLIRVSSLTFIWTPLTTPQIILLQRKLDFKTPASIAITTKIVGSTIGITFAYMGYGLWAIVIMQVISSFLSFLLYWTIVRWVPTASWSKESFNYLWGYGNKLVASNLIGTIYNNIGPIIIGKYYSTNELGVYNRAQGYADLPAIQGTKILMQVSFPILSKLQSDNEALARNYRKMLKVSAFVLFPIMTMLAALAKPFIIILVTDKWIDAVLLLQLLCFATMWYPIHTINLNLLQVKGRSDLFLKIEIWKKILSIVVILCVLPLGLVYFVAAGIFVSILNLCINTYYTGKLINVNFIIQMRDILPSFLLSFFVFAFLLIMNLFITDLHMQLFFGIIAGSAIYIIGAFVFKFKELDDVKYMLNIKRNE